jgi:DNA (cytosine-5)-methyltransferase 1
MLPGIPRLTARLRAAVQHELVVDNFAGAGGASLGIEAALGRCVDIAINHSRKAVDIHILNHPNTRHLCENVWDVDPLEATGGRPVGLAWFSPDCKHFSKAKGGKPLNKHIRGLAWVVVKWAKALGPKRPRVIILENVEEFVTWGPLDAAGNVIQARKGQTFLRWVAMLRNLGYEVEHRELVAADYGTPTTRKRFFLIARCDGLAIRWPERTHAPRAKAKALHLKPWRAAAECIDWSLPCRSIFERKRPLAEATMRRIARGLVRYVINAAEPFIVTCNHGGDTGGLRSAGEPVRTVTGSRDANGVVVPCVVQTSHTGSTGRGQATWAPDVPLRTLTARNENGLVEAFLSKYHGQRPGERDGRCSSPDEPVKTLDTSNRYEVVAATLMTNTSGHAATDLSSPSPTLTSGGQQAVIGATLIQTGYGEREGQAPRVPGLDKPLGTVVGGGAKHALVACSQEPVAGGETAKSSAASACSALNASSSPTIRRGGLPATSHVGEVRAFLVKYYGSGGQDADCRNPMHTLTAKARMGLVTVAGQEYQITDIGLRMLEPRELLRAQFGRFAGEYILHGTKADQVAAIGNSVCPELAEAIVRANMVAGGEGRNAEC